MSTPILKTLQADPDRVLDMGQHEPAGLIGPAKQVWDLFAASTPYWWSEADLLTIERYCFLIGVDRTLRDQMNRAHEEANAKIYQSGWAAMKSLSLEITKVEYALGVTPQGRAALKLAYDPGQAEREKVDEVEEPLDPEDL